MITENGKVYLSVKEYAEAAEISKQAVYKQLSTRLVDYIKEVENQTYINAAALDKYYGEEASTTVEQLKQLEVERIRQQDKEKIEQLKAMNELLQRELEQKNKQIDDLSSRLKEAIKSIENEQTLHLATQQKLLLIEQQEEEAAAEAEKQEQEQESSGFFGRIFKKK